MKNNASPKTTFQEIVRRQEVAKTQEEHKMAIIALTAAAVINIVSLLGCTVFQQLGAVLFIAFRGILNIVAFVVILCLAIPNLKNPKTRSMAIIVIILDILSLWPFIRFNIFSLWFS